MFVSVGLILLLSCLFNANGYPVERRPVLLRYLPDNWRVIGQSRRHMQRPYAVPDPTQTLICRIMLPVLNLSSMMGGGMVGGGGGSVDGSLPLFILPGQPQFVLRRRVSNHQPDIDIEPWEVLAYTPNSNSQEPDITSLLAAPAPVLCVAPDRPRPHPVLLAPVPPLSPTEQLGSPPQGAIVRPPGGPFPYTVQAAPPTHGFLLEPSVNPAILESLIYSAQNRPLFSSPDRLQQSPNGPPNYYRPHYDSTKSADSLQGSLPNILDTSAALQNKIVPGILSEFTEIEEEEGNAGEEMEKGGEEQEEEEQKVVEKEKQEKEEKQKDEKKVEVGEKRQKINQEGKIEENQEKERISEGTQQKI